MAPPGAPACRPPTRAQARTCRLNNILPYPTLIYTPSACLQSGGARAGEYLPPAAAAAGSWLALEGSRSSSAPSSAETEPLLGGGGGGGGGGGSAVAPASDGGARSGLARAAHPGGQWGGGAGAGHREPRARDGSGSVPGPARLACIPSPFESAAAQGAGGGEAGRGPGPMPAAGTARNDASWDDARGARQGRRVNFSEGV